VSTVRGDAASTSPLPFVLSWRARRSALAADRTPASMATSTLRRLKSRPRIVNRERELLWYRAMRALVRHGRIPGSRHGGGSVVWALVVHVLAQGPQCVSSNARVAEALGVSRRTVISASAAASGIEISPGVPLLRLRRDFIVVPLHGACPWDPEGDADWARSNKHGWAVAARELLEAIGAEHAAEAQARKGKKAARRAERREAWAAEHGIALVDHPHGCREPASTLDPELDGELNTASHGLGLGEGPRGFAASVEEAPPEGGAARAYHRRAGPTDGARQSEERPWGEEHGACPKARAPAPQAQAVDPDVEQLAAQWNAQGFHNANGSPSVAGVVELRTLAARLRAGYSVDDLRAAIIGAGAPESWARRGKAQTAFGLTFARINGSLDRHIHEGRKMGGGAARGSADPLASLLVDAPDLAPEGEGES
jgi:hypothetical protein